MRVTPLSAFLLALAAAPATAAGFADPATIDQAVAQFTGAPIGAPGGARLPVDRRLKLAECPAQLALEWYGTRHESVLVRCPQIGGWRLFVPVDSAPAASAQVAVTRGDSVTIVVQGDGFSLSRTGEALEGGAIGEWIRVRPLGTKTDPIRARIIDAGKVGMELP